MAHCPQQLRSLAALCTAQHVSVYVAVDCPTPRPAVLDHVHVQAYKRNSVCTINIMPVPVCSEAAVLQQQQPYASPPVAPADIQKASKQAIYSLLRGDFDRAAQQHHSAGESLSE